MTDFLREGAEWKKRKDAHYDREARLTQAERIAAIKERLAASSAGPWRACGDERGGCQCCLIYGEKAIVAKSTYNEGDEEEQPGRVEDASFIAHAHQDVPWLLALVETDVARAEGEEASRWAADELERLRAENARLRVVHEMIKKTGTYEDDLREAIVAVDEVAWRLERPEDLKQMPAWALRRPLADEDERERMRAWMEGGAAIVSDGRALLHVRGVAIARHQAPESASAADKIMKEMDWSSPRTATYAMLREILDALLPAPGEDALTVEIGWARFDPDLIDHFLPRLAADAVLDVFCGSGNREPIAIRPHGSDAWTMIAMPIVDTDVGRTLELQPLA